MPEFKRYELKDFPQDRLLGRLAIEIEEQLRGAIAEEVERIWPRVASEVVARVAGQLHERFDFMRHETVLRIEVDLKPRTVR